MSQPAFSPGDSFWRPTNLSVHAPHEFGAWLARCARLAYRPMGMRQRQCRAWNLTAFSSINERGTQAFAAADGTLVVIAFRGTDETCDWWNNLNRRLVDSPRFVRGKIHRGFRDAFFRSYDWLRAMARQIGERRVYVTGHSLGGALATLASYVLALRSIRVAGVHTFGSPRVGDAQFARVYERVLGGLTYRWRNNNDAVTRLPCWSCGYRHVGQLKYLDAQGRLRESAPWLFRARDALAGRLAHLGRCGTDGIADHSIDSYVDLISAHVEGRTHERTTTHQRNPRGTASAQGS